MLMTYNVDFSFVIDILHLGIIVFIPMDGLRLLYELGGGHELGLSFCVISFSAWRDNVKVARSAAYPFMSRHVAREIFTALVSSEFSV